MRLKREQFKRDMHRVSEEKSRKLFEKDEDRNAWVEVIRKSVEKEIELRVREALGTPPKERQRKRLQELTAKRLAKIDEEKRAMAITIRRQASFEKRVEEDDELLWLRRQKYLEKFNRRRTMREVPSPVLHSITAKRHTSVSPKSEQTSPVVWQSCETLPSQILTCPTQFKRAVSASSYAETTKEPETRDGPYFPSGRMPCMPPPKHLNCIPNFFEDLNIPEANETCAKVKEHPDYPKCWRGSVVVFDTERRNTVDSDAVPPGCPPHLQFESRFESGNLRQVKRVGNYEYELALNTDLYTKRHTQWYYFQVRKTIPGVTYTFTIINFLKKDSLYNHGMKPLFYSEKTAERKQLGWMRRGHHIKYFQNYIKGHPLLSRDKIYYSLTFQMEFPHVNDVCYLTHCYPYTYTDLENDLQTITNDPIKYRYCKQQVLCKTIAGNNCYVLTVTSKDSCEDKLGVVVTARVHPGETNASWMMKGLLDFLTSEDPVAENLRRKHVFKIIPMLNPDGVIVGNYRTNLAARDLNRTYMSPKKETSPTVYHTKKLVESFSSEQEIVIYCDLHGHSRKPNVFMYGCTPDSRATSVKDFVQERLFPWLMSKKAPDLFSFRECKFKVRKCKEGTARVVMWRQLGVANSFTMEATFCGANFGNIAKGRHFHCGDFEAMGRHFCEVLMDYTHARPEGCRSEITEAFLEMASRMTQDIIHHARLLQQRRNEACCSVDGRVKSTCALRNNHVNVFDVHVGDLSAGVEFDEVEVSVRKSEGTSLEDCLKQLNGLDLQALQMESDSSDSDSHSEGEDTSTKLKQGKKLEERRKKKKKKKPAKRWEVLASLKQRPEAQNEEKDIKQMPKDKEKYKRVRLNQNTFVNPYTTRFNNGIPIYSQERIDERIKKKNEETANESEPSSVEYNPLPVLREDGLMASYNMELYNIVPQRNLACYVLPREPGAATADSRVQAVGVDTFRFDTLSNSASKGFTIRMPGREDSATRSDNESFRLDPETEDELYYGDQNPGMRNTVTLNPLHHPQSTAYAYDLNELSRTANEATYTTANDSELKSNQFYTYKQNPTRVVRKFSHNGLSDAIPRSENKLRSLQRLKHLSLEDKTARKNALE